MLYLWSGCKKQIEILTSRCYLDEPVMSMTIPQQQFLELLRAGLWGRPADAELFKGTVDWKTIIRIAIAQAVPVIVADGVESLPKELWPPKEAMLKLMMMRVKIGQMHKLLDATLNRIVSALEAEGLSSVLLKGQGVAQNYVNPASRSCGDIDLYVGLEGYERACEIIAGLGSGHEEGEECDHHMHLQVDGVEVEIHRRAHVLRNKRQDRFFQKWTSDSVDARFGTQSLRAWDNAGTTVNLAPATFDAFFILHHAVRHMTTEGVGFRQICDWTMYLHKHHDEIDVDELRTALKALDMETIWMEFGRMAISILGLPPAELPLCPAVHSSRKTDELARHIFISGNFGRYDENGRDHSQTTYMKRKWRSFKFQSLRLCKLFSLFPSYTLAYGWGWLTSGIRIVLSGK